MRSEGEGVGVGEGDRVESRGTVTLTPPVCSCMYMYIHMCVHLLLAVRAHSTPWATGLHGDVVKVKLAHVVIVPRVKLDGKGAIEATVA